MTQTKDGGAWHCSDPENCGGMKPMRSACTCNEPWCKACALTPSAATDNTALVEALREVSQALAWQCFGECRGFSENLKSPSEALSLARTALASHEAPQAATPTAQEAVPTEDELDEAWKSGFNAGFGEAKLTTNPPQPSESVAEAALCSEILAELTRARTKFPGKNVTFAALVEEVGELATATFEESADRVRKEAVQVAVMAMRMILDGDHCYEPWRAEKGLDPLDPALRALKGEDHG